MAGSFLLRTPRAGKTRAPFGRDPKRQVASARLAPNYTGAESRLERLRELGLALPDTSERLSHGSPHFFAGTRDFVAFWNKEIAGIVGVTHHTVAARSRPAMRHR
jgi:hypothetical protein